MGILDSSVARLMLIVLTVAIGLVTLKSQSEFWFGALVAIAVVWGLIAFGNLVLARWQKSRTFWMAFLIATSISLTLGFGPFSDAAMRGSVPNRSNAFISYLGEIHSMTKAFWWLRRYIRPAERAEITTYNREGRVGRWIGLVLPSDSPVSLEESVISLENFVLQDMELDEECFPSRRSNATRQVVIPDSIAVYLDASYLLASLLIGGISGTMVSFLRSRRGRAVESDLHPMTEARSTLLSGVPNFSFHNTTLANGLEVIAELNDLANRWPRASS